MKSFFANMVAWCNCLCSILQSYYNLAYTVIICIDLFWINFSRVYISSAATHMITRCYDNNMKVDAQNDYRYTCNDISFYHIRSIYIYHTGRDNSADASWAIECKTRHEAFSPNMLISGCLCLIWMWTHLS